MLPRSPEMAGKRDVEGITSDAASTAGEACTVSFNNARMQFQLQLRLWEGKFVSPLQVSIVFWIGTSGMLPLFMTITY